jgi:signal transduction histidine kinase
MKNSYTFLYLEDSQEDLELLAETLKAEYIPCDVTWVNGKDAFKSALSGGWGFDLIFADYFLPDITGDEALSLARTLCPDVPFIFLSGSMGEEKAVECLRNGATDYVLKTNLSRLAPVVRRAIEEARMGTARREAEAATNRVVSLLRATLESTAEGILVVDLAGKVSTYNRKFMSLCGIPDYVMAPMDMERVLQFLLDQFHDPEAFLAEARLLGSQPERESFGMLTLKGERVLEERSRPHRIGNQTVGRVYSFHDVTEREKHNDLLTGLAHNRQRLLEATGAGGVVPWCLSEDSLLLSDAAERVLGVHAGALPRDLPDLMAIIHSEELDRFRQALERPMPGFFDLRLRKGDGTWIWTRWTLERDPSAGYRGIFMDITDHHRKEEGFASRRRSQGMAWMAENSARILDGLLKQAEGPLRRLPEAGALSKAQEDQRQACASALDRMKGFLAQLTSAVLCTPDTSRARELKGFLADFQPLAEDLLGPDLKLRIETAPGLPALTVAPEHLRQMLLPLLRNAREAQAGAGIVLLRFAQGKSHPPCADCGGCVCVEVIDSGPGLPPSVEARMLDPFFTTKGEAYGLGLSVVRTMIDSYKGTLEVANTPIRGTTIRLHLPATKA